MQGRPHDADERALTRRQLGAHRVGKMRDPEPFETRVDLRVRIRDAVEAAIEPQVLAHAQSFRERQVAGGEPDL